MADVRFWVLVILYIIWWPINQILRGTIFVLTPIWTFASFILLPFMHLAQTLYDIVSFPFRGKWLDRIETLYVYLGTAGLIGCITGAVVFLIFKFISSSLHLDASIVPQPQPRHQGRTATQFRAEQRVKREESMGHSPVSTPVVLKRVPGSRRQGLLSQAIIEEEDSDF